MSDYSAPLALPDHKRGDRWQGLVIGPILFAGAAPAVALTRVRMHFKRVGLIYRLDTNASLRDAPITITNASTWIATIPAIENGFLAASAGCWSFDIEFYGTGQGPVTLIKGTIFVHEDETR